MTLKRKAVEAELRAVTENSAELEMLTSRLGGAALLGSVRTLAEHALRADDAIRDVACRLDETCDFTWDTPSLEALEGNLPVFRDMLRAALLERE